MKDLLLDASSRVALAAYLHDLGKFAERAGIEEAGEKADSSGNTFKDLNKQQYCPQYNNRYSHIHAAYTAIAMDVIEPYLPDIKAGDCSPFASWSSPANIKDGDSLINAAARHHKPETFLQWIIASADRLASGFERSEFEDYNRAEEEIGSNDASKKRTSYLRARQYTLFENIQLSERKKSYEWRYPLVPLSPDALFPVKASVCEPSDDQAARTEYKKLWGGFLTALRREDGGEAIPRSHKSNLSMWLDHFDSLWMTFSHAIPSATAGKVDGKFIDIPADVSLYDHSRTTAALAVALWRWHSSNHTIDAGAIFALKEGTEDDTEKLLLVQGDMAGIQEFIFASGGSSQKFAAKLLRGRSFMVSLLAECAALRILEALSLPPTSQVVNAAGKFLILAPNTPEVVENLESVRAEINDWFLNKSQGRAGLTLAWLPATSNNFRHGASRSSDFANLMQRLFALLDRQKLQRMDLCSTQSPAIFQNYMDAFAEKGECQLDEYSPAETDYKESVLSRLAKDQILTGTYLSDPALNRVLITRSTVNEKTLHTDFFGYYITFTSSEEVSGKFGALAGSGQLLRAWDYSLPKSGSDPLWNGYARRFINAYVPVFDAYDGILPDKYRRLDPEIDFDGKRNAIKPLDCVADEDRFLEQGDEKTHWRGISALQTLKGDVDNLGLIFQKGLERPSFAKMAALSRQMNAFFAIWLPWRCKRDFPNTYTVFAGGDDFFLIGPWKKQMALAIEMHNDFSRYVANNSDIHFSAGLYLSKPGQPIRHIGLQAEESLRSAKQHDNGGKNAITCFGQTVKWNHFESLIQVSQDLDEWRKSLGLSTGFIYGLLRLSEMAGEEKRIPESALWRSWLAYRVQRNIGDRMRRYEKEEGQDFEKRRKALVTDVICKLTEDITQYGRGYHIALYSHLYQHRD